MSEREKLTCKKRKERAAKAFADAFRDGGQFFPSYADHDHRGIYLRDMIAIAILPYSMERNGGHAALAAEEAYAVAIAMIEERDKIIAAEAQAGREASLEVKEATAPGPAGGARGET